MRKIQNNTLIAVIECTGKPQRFISSVRAILPLNIIELEATDNTVSVCLFDYRNHVILVTKTLADYLSKVCILKAYFSPDERDLLELLKALDVGQFHLHLTAFLSSQFKDHLTRSKTSLKEGINPTKVSTLKPGLRVG